MNSGIYCFTNLIDDKKYIGQSQNINKRLKEHLRTLRKNESKNPFLQRAWNKYGENNFEISIICECPLEELSELETFYIQKLHSYSTEWGYNLTLGGEGTRGFTQPQSVRDAVAKANSLRIMTNETRKKYSDAAKGRVFTEEHKRKIREANINPSDEVRKRQSEVKMGNQVWLGRKHSNETRQKMRESAKLRWANAKKSTINLSENDVIEDWHGMKLIRISAVPGFSEWLYGQTLPLVDENEEPFSWAYAWDYERFIKKLPIID